MQAPKYEPVPVYKSESEVKAILESGSTEDLMVLSLALGLTGNTRRICASVWRTIRTMESGRMRVLRLPI